MKHFANRALMMFALLMTLSVASSSQIVVRVRPAQPVMRPRPIAPSPRHVWVDGGWAYRGNGYVWSDGYWVVPRQGMVWVGGGWRRRHGGYYWVPGHWRRR